MNIIKSESIPSISNLQNKEKFTNQLVQQVMSICKEDKTFSIIDKIKKLDVYKDSLKKKDIQLETLLEKSNKIKEDFNKQITEIEIDNTNTKNKLIKFLGGEI